MTLSKLLRVRAAEVPRRDLPRMLGRTLTFGEFDREVQSVRIADPGNNFAAGILEQPAQRFREEGGVLGDQYEHGSSASISVPLGVLLWTCSRMEPVPAVNSPTFVVDSSGRRSDVSKRERMLRALRGGHGEVTQLM